MNKNELITEVTKMIEAPSCYEGLKEIAQKWIAAVKVGDAKEEAKILVKAAEECLEPIDGLVAFAESSAAVDVLGKEVAEGLKAHAHELKASGAKHCDCGACEGCKFILANKEAFLGK